MKRLPISVACTGADVTGIEHLHETCRGNGPMYLPGITAPVLPAEDCACECHSTCSCDSDQSGAS